MKAEKEDLFFVEAIDLVKGFDFEVVTDTEFNKEVVHPFYEFENHIIDYELIEILGLGVVRSLHFEDDYYVYNASSDHVDDNFGMA